MHKIPTVLNGYESPRISVAPAAAGGDDCARGAMPSGIVAQDDRSAGSDDLARRRDAVAANERGVRAVVDGVRLPHRGRIVQVGPGLDTRGGIASLERLIIDGIAPAISIEHIATMRDGSLFGKLVCFGTAIRRLRRELCSPDPRVIHIHFASRGSTLRKTILAWMTIRAKRSVVLHAHGAGFDQFYAALGQPLQRLVSSVFRRVDHFIVVSEWWKKVYVANCGVPPEKVSVLVNPTRIPPHCPDRRGRRIVQLLFLGRMNERKGAHDLARAFASLPSAVRERARLVVAGDGDRAALQTMAMELRCPVTIHSWVDSIQRDALLAESDIFVLPSRAECVPMALLEAMSFGLPSITTAVGGIPEVVTDNREGLLVVPGDVRGLAASMERLIEDEDARLAMGNRARARAQRFDLERYTADLLRIYHDCFERRG